MMCSRCGERPRGTGRRNTWCRECKNAWQRDYRKGVKRFRPVPDPVETETGCLIWQGTVHPNGYGQQTYQGRFTYAHRIAWEKAHGPIPDGLTVDHLCLVKACVNVAHMELVTRAENTRRANERRRRVRGCGA